MIVGLQTLQKKLFLCLLVSFSFQVMSVRAGGNQEEPENEQQRTFGAFFRFASTHAKGTPKTIEQLDGYFKEFYETNQVLAQEDINAYYSFRKDPHVRHALLKPTFWKEVAQNSLIDGTKAGTKALIELLAKYALAPLDPNLTLQQRQQSYNEKKELLDNLTQTLNSGQFNGPEKELLKKVYLQIVQELRTFGPVESACDGKKACSRLKTIIEKYNMYQVSNSTLTVDANTRVENFEKHNLPLIEKFVLGQSFEESPLLKLYRDQRYTKEELEALEQLNVDFGSIGDDFEKAIDQMKLKDTQNFTGTQTELNKLLDQQKEQKKEFAKRIKEFTKKLSNELHNNHTTLVAEDFERAPGVFEQVGNIFSGAGNATVGGVKVKTMLFYTTATISATASTLAALAAVIAWLSNGAQGA